MRTVLDEGLLKLEDLRSQRVAGVGTRSSKEDYHGTMSRQGSSFFDFRYFWLRMREEAENSMKNKRSAATNTEQARQTLMTTGHETAPPKLACPFFLHPPPHWIYKEYVRNDAK